MQHHQNNRREAKRHHSKEGERSTTQRGEGGKQALGSSNPPSFFALPAVGVGLCGPCQLIWLLFFFGPDPGAPRHVFEKSRLANEIQ